MGFLTCTLFLFGRLNEECEEPNIFNKKVEIYSWLPTIKVH